MRVLLAVITLAAGLVPAAFADEAAGAAPIQQARWLAADADILRFLSETPGECLAAPDDPDTAFLVEAGRTAFKSPLLFGGPAARGGLSCNSCHRDGRDNPSFFLAGLSGEPGTADVTSSLFSKTRDDGVFNPVLIPDLVGIGDKKSFGTSDPKPTLHDFVESAVLDEFQGAPPPSLIVDAIAQYVTHLNRNACPDAPVPETVARAMQDVERALVAAHGALERGDGAAGDFLILSAQRAVGVVHERFAGPKLADERALLVDFSRSLAAVRPLTESDPESARAALAAALMDSATITRALHKRHKKSLYHLKVLQRAVEGD